MSKLFFVVGLAAVVTSVIALAAGWVDWGALVLRTDFIVAALGVLTSMLVVAAVLERAMAVINRIVFGDRLIDEQARCEIAGGSGNPLELQRAAREIARIEGEIEVSRLRFSFLVGFFVALAGIRVFAPLVSTGGSLPSQVYLLNAIDCLLTAALLAGGSNAIAGLVVKLQEALQLQRENPALKARVFAMRATQHAPDDTEAYDEWAVRGSLYGTSKSDHWRLADSLKRLIAQVNERFPSRSTASDGTIGDSAHCPGPSDHCPNIPDGDYGVVTACDITHHPASGCDMDEFTEALRDSRDDRIKYVIWKRRIFSSYARGGRLAWEWGHYSGANPHTQHAHISVAAEKALYDNSRDWRIAP